MSDSSLSKVKKTLPGFWVCAGEPLSVTMADQDKKQDIQDQQTKVLQKLRGFSKLTALHCQKQVKYLLTHILSGQFVQME